MRISDGGRPETETVVMLCCQDDIARADSLEQRRPCFRVPSSRALIERLRKLVIIEIFPVGLEVVFVSRGAGNAKRVQIPLGVRIIDKPGVRLNFSKLACRRSPGRHRIQTPMDEDSKLRILIPRGDRMCLY